MSTKKKPISVAARKQKGRLLQQYVRGTILHRYKTLEPDDVKSTSMGASGEDLQLSPAARKLLPLSVECKSLHSIILYKWYDQASSNCPKGSEPIVVAKANRRKPVVIIDANTFFDILESSNGLKLRQGVRNDPIRRC